AVVVAFPRVGMYFGLTASTRVSIFSLQASSFFPFTPLSVGRHLIAGVIYTSLRSIPTRLSSSRRTVADFPRGIRFDRSSSGLTDSVTTMILAFFGPDPQTQTFVAFFQRSQSLHFGFRPPEGNLSAVIGYPSLSISNTSTRHPRMFAT